MRDGRVDGVRTARRQPGRRLVRIEHTERAGQGSEQRGGVERLVPAGGRPGARRDSVENYIKRLADIEAIANSFPSVEKSFAISAGREVRVFVKPDEMSDLAARELARNIALRIESELKYPGEVKVMVIRETRAIEFAR